MSKITRKDYDHALDRFIDITRQYISEREKADTALLDRVRDMAEGEAFTSGQDMMVIYMCDLVEIIDELQAEVSGEKA